MSTTRPISYAKSFLNYPGGKYRIINRLLAYFPEHVDNFVDLFSGSGVVTENYDRANHYLANDAQASIIELQDYLKVHPYPDSLQIVKQIIQDYHLTDTAQYGYQHYGADSSQGLASINKEAYLQLRSDYTKGTYPYPRELVLYVLIIYGFNNQLRFNKHGYFNNPVGKRDFNSAMQKKLAMFVDIMRKKDVQFTSQDFRNIDIVPNSFIYADPPYLITTAVYNENGGWSEQDERDLLDYLDRADRNGAKFALSNVTRHKGKYNTTLLEWAQKYHTHHIQNDYSNANYHTKKAPSDEVLITNY